MLVLQTAGKTIITRITFLFKFVSDGFLVCTICNSADFLKYFIFAKSRMRNKINVVLFNVLLESHH